MALRGTDTHRSATRWVVGVGALAALVAASGTAWATNWVVTLKASSAGEAKAQAAPAAPASPAAACTSSSAKTIKVSWTAVAKATTYTVYDTTTSASGTYASLATGVTGTTYTTASLSSANYWFEVAAYIGTNWIGSKSAATGETTISSSGCVQP